ncbi:hypothetical protein HDK64DRAFT_254699 [Phyllosticta capitalensis]
MPAPLRPPDDARSAPTRPAGFWSQEHLHMRPRQSQRQQSPPPSLRERLQRLEQKPQNLDEQDETVPQQQPWHAGLFGGLRFKLKQTNLGQQQSETAPPDPAPVPAQRQPSPEPFEHTQLPDETSEEMESISPAHQYGAMHPQRLQALGGPGEQVAPSPQDHPAVSSATWETDQYQVQPFREPYSPPVRSIEADQTNPSEFSSIIPGPSTSIDQPNSRDDEYDTQRTLSAPLAPALDLNDLSLPLSDRYAAWKQFASETAEAQKQWVEDGCPPCTASKCRDRSHPPPHRSRKAEGHHYCVTNFGNWLSAVYAGGRSPCLTCGRLHKGGCSAVRCDNCGADHDEYYSCRTAHIRTAAANEVHQQREGQRQRKNQNMRQKMQQQMQRQTLRQTQRLAQHSPPPKPATPPPPGPPEDRLGTMELDFMRKMVEKNQWAADKWGTFTARRDAAGQTRMRSGFVELMMARDEWGADEWATFMESYDATMRSHGTL